MPNPEAAIGLINSVAFVTFVALLGAAVVRMLLRIVFYARVGRRANIILRRDLLLLGSLLLVFGSVAFIRFFGLDQLLETGWPRFFYVLVSDVVAIGALGYWVWAEFFVIGRPDKEDE